MFRAERVQVPIQNRNGRSVGIIEIHLLPGDEQASRPEIFRPDTVEGLTGRLRPGLYTGTLPVNVFVGERHIGSFELEVRASKLDYLSHYRWMLRDLAEAFVEVIMRRFAPIETRFTFRFDADASTLYQRFSFLKSLLADDTLGSAVAKILSSPHQEWRVECEKRPVGRSVPAGPGVARAIAKSGPACHGDARKEALSSIRYQRAFPCPALSRLTTLCQTASSSIH